MKEDDHLLERGLGLGQAILEQALLEQDVLEIALGLFDGFEATADPR
jgi:hypothetical protein